MTYYNNELYHFGIKGMKWGVRRYQNEDGSYTSLGKERRRVDYSDDYKRASELKKRDPRTLSNKELTELNTRMQLEMNYKSLMSSGKKKGTGIIKSFYNKTIDKLSEEGSRRIAKYVVSALAIYGSTKLGVFDMHGAWLF